MPPECRDIRGSVPNRRTNRRNPYVGANLRLQFSIHAIDNKAGRYMFARLDGAGQTAYLVLAVGEQSTDMHVIEMKKMETGKVSVNLENLLAGLDKDGYVVLEGIYFETAKTEIKPESRPAIAQVAALLRKSRISVSMSSVIPTRREH
ncbi:MAG: hypothetical protein ABI718_12235 [Acidobacteriota bacterium]